MRNKKIYGNYKVLAPDGELLNLVLEKRIKWYLDRNLADIVDDKTIKLKFEPKSRKKDNYVISVKENKCVVCGETKLEVLTKHHIVPSEYRKLFPIELKSRNSHDIVAICQDCHNEYEINYAKNLRLFIADKYNVPLSKNNLNDPIVRAKKIAYIFIKHFNVIPIKRKNYLINEFIKYTDMKSPTLNDFKNYINAYSDYKPTNHAEIIIDILKENNDFFDFIKMWRKHFIDSMMPKYMPKYWSINRKQEI